MDGPMRDKNSSLKPQNLICEYITDPVGIDTPKPRFSWQVITPVRGGAQSGYQIMVSSSPDFTNETEIKWDSGQIASGDSVNIVYNGVPLLSRRQYWWRVRIWDRVGNVSRWSSVAGFETALLQPTEWQASWIRGANLYRKAFLVDKKVVKARIYICGLGYYVLHFNGSKVGDHVLDPAWTDFDQKIFYVAYDVTQAVREGENVIGVMLGNGRYSPYDETCAKNWHPLKKYGPSPVLILQQHLTYSDGSETVIVTDTTWKTTNGPIIRDDIYDGEIYDARREVPGWDSCGFEDVNWEFAQPVQEKMGKLVSQTGFPAIKVIKPRTAISMTQPAPNTYLYDFGQNFSGWVRLKVKGPAGSTVKLHFAELKHDDTGMLNPNTNRGAAATDTYICKGTGVEEYEPHFTYHGFRYVELTGFPGTPTIDSVEGRVVHSSVTPVGSFFCSNELINKIHSNYCWTQLSNLHSVPTDCCQRDERMGWVGDAQLSAEAAVFNFDMAGFYTKFAADIRESQLETGSVAGVSPAYWSCYPADPTYATACVEFPWLVSHYYDDPQIIEENLAAMTKWVDFLGSQADSDGIVSFGLFGDWCPPMHANPVDTPFEITSTWYYCHDALMVSRMAERLGRADLAAKYYQVFCNARDAFNKQYLKGDRYSASKYSDTELAEKIKSWLNVLPEEQRPAVMKRYATLYSASSQTANLLPLWLGIVPEDKIQDVLQTLIQDLVVTRSWHINTGVVGVKFLFDVLLNYGYADLAFRLITQTTFPSWGYQIREGATTLWERWEYLSNDKCFNSHSHPFSGSIDAWFYKNFGGIAIDIFSSGFRKIKMRPVLAGDLAYASAMVDTVRGTVSSRWERSATKLLYTITIPGNTEATVSIPKNGWENPLIKEGGVILWRDGKPGMVAGIDGGVNESEYITFNVGAGHYEFTITSE
jgi:alpha-L-rhamnosidase